MNELLLSLYYEKEDYIIDYERVDRYYAYLGYDLEIEHLLQGLGVYGTSDLMELLINTEKGV